MYSLPVVGVTQKYERETMGGFSEPGKMPWLSWNTPASRCKTGSRLREVSGSVCDGCYAHKGNYAWPNVQESLQNRFRKLDDLGAWAEHMVECLLSRAAKFRQTRWDRWPAFRWHDSGDLQSASHLLAIFDVALRTQDASLANGATEDVRHWLPTREYGMVSAALRRMDVPRNLVVRLSAHMVDGPAPFKYGLPVSTVHTSPGVYPEAHHCPAYSRRPASCGPCRACWDPDVPHVSYKNH